MSRVWLWAIAAILPLASCAVTPTYVLDLMDAESDEEVEDAVADASNLVADGRRSEAVRMAAAKTLGRLRSASSVAVDGLRRALQDPAAGTPVRSYAAWALGELRSEGSLVALTAALRIRPDATVGHYVLEGIAKHAAIMSREVDSVVEIVDAMVFYAGNQRADMPAVYDLIGARTRTVAVNVKVLERAIEAVETKGDDTQRAAMYNAAFELLAKLDSTRDEIIAGPAVWATRVDESMRASQRIFTTRDPRAVLIVLWYLGKLGRVPELGGPAAHVLVGADGKVKGRPTQSPDPKARLLAAWALSRVQIHGVGPRRALAADVLPAEAEPVILELLGALSPRPNEPDQLQKIVGVREEVRSE